MKIDRRKFFKFAGGAVVLTAAGKTAFEAVASDEIKESAGRGAKRWAMAIDLRYFDEKDYAKCINACNAAHNVPQFPDEKDQIKWIWTETYHHAFIEQETEKFLPKELKHKSVLLLCNHCDNPPCVNVCPTQATWAREDGIVMMDWHRCIGCRYCIAACPYGSRSFNWREPRPKDNPNKYIEKINSNFPSRTRGVVEKCTFCAELMVDGEYAAPPYCVRAAKKGSIYFGDLNDKNSEVYKVLTERFSVRRKPSLGTHPEVYYLVDEED